MTDIDDHFRNLFREQTATEVLEAQKKALEAATRYLEDLKAGRVPPPQRPPQIIPPQLWLRLRQRGWIDERGEWTAAGWEELSRLPVP